MDPVVRRFDGNRSLTVVISAGFAEVNREGERLQEEVACLAKAAGIPLIGPNCMGLWSSPVNLNLAFEEAPHPGSIAFISQSGTLGNYLMLLAKGEGIRVSRFYQQREPGPSGSLRLSRLFREG